MPLPKIQSPFDIDPRNIIQGANALAGMRRGRESRNALESYMRTEDPARRRNALADLMKADPQTGMQLWDREQNVMAQQAEQREAGAAQLAKAKEELAQREQDAGAKAVAAALRADTPETMKQAYERTSAALGFPVDPDMSPDWIADEKKGTITATAEGTTMEFPSDKRDIMAEELEAMGIHGFARLVRAGAMNLSAEEPKAEEEKTIKSDVGLGISAEGSPEKVQALQAFVAENPSATEEEIIKHGTNLGLSTEKRWKDPEEKAFSLVLPDGTSIQYGSISEGVGGALADQTTATQTRLQNEIVKNTRTLESFKTMGKEIRPDWFSGWERGKQAGAEFAEIWTPYEPTGEIKEKMTAYAAWHSKSLNLINQYIHDVTGAQMNEYETKRIRGALPDPGEEWWNIPQGYTRFVSRYDSLTSELERAGKMYEDMLAAGKSKEAAQEAARGVLDKTLGPAGATEKNQEGRRSANRKDEVMGVLEDAYGQ